MLACLKRNDVCSADVKLIALPFNDWNFLARDVCPKLKSLFPADELQLLASIVPGSFYGQLLPSESITIGVSATTYHWTSQAPTGTARNHVLIQLQSPTDSSALTDMQLWKRQAATDWTAFLQSRALELQSGGLLFLTGLCWKQENEVGYSAVFGILRECLEDLQQENLISKEQLAKVLLPLYIRKLDECTIPEDHTNARLKLLHSEEYEDTSPIYLSWLKHRDSDLFGRHFAEFLKSAYEPIIQSLLLKEVSTEFDVVAACKRLWERYAARVSASPDSVARPSFMVLVAQKV